MGICMCVIKNSLLKLTTSGSKLRNSLHRIGALQWVKLSPTALPSPRWDWDSYYNVPLVLTSLHPQQDLDPFSHVCTAKPRETVWQTDRQTDWLTQQPRYGIKGHNSPHLMHSMRLIKQEAKGISRRLHRMTPCTQHAAYAARAAADLSPVTDRLTDRQTPRTSVTIVSISCIRCSPIKWWLPSVQGSLVENSDDPSRFQGPDADRQVSNLFYSFYFSTARRTRSTLGQL